MMKINTTKIWILIQHKYPYISPRKLVLKQRVIKFPYLQTRNRDKNAQREPQQFFTIINGSKRKYLKEKV